MNADATTNAVDRDPTNGPRTATLDRREVTVSDVRPPQAHLQLACDALPDELLAYILSFLPCALGRGVCARVCSRWRQVASDDRAIGRTHCHRSKDLPRDWQQPVVTYYRMYRQVSACDRAAAAGHVDCLVYARNRQHVWDTTTCALAARYGHVDVLRFLSENGCPQTDQVSTYLNDLYKDAVATSNHELVMMAVASGNIDCVEYLSKSRAIPLSSALFKVAAESGHVHTMRYGVEQGLATRLAYDACEAAARGGHIQCLVYAREIGCPWGKNLCASAVEGGSIECLAYTHQNGGRLINCMWLDAIERGRIEIVRYACENGWAPTRRAMRVAVTSGRVDMVRCVCRRGDAAWNADDLCAMAAGSGSLDIVRYLCEIGYGQSKGACTAAARADRPDILAYLHEHGCPWDRPSCLYWARCRGLNCLSYLYEHKCRETCAYPIQSLPYAGLSLPAMLTRLRC